MANETLTTFSNYMKTKFGTVSDNVYNTATPLLAMIKRTQDFVGEDQKYPIPTGYEGGVGSGSLPTAGKSNAEKLTFSTKKVYARVAIERQLMKQASNKDGAFVKALAHKMKKGVESYVRNDSRMIFGLGTGELCVGSASAANVTGDGSTATPYLVTIKSQKSTSGAITQNKRANLEKRDLVNVNSETTDLEIVSVLVEADFDIVVGLVGTSARLATLTTANPFTTTDKLYMQGSKDADISGLREICDATSGTKFGITIGDRWQAFQKAVSSGSVTEDLLTEVLYGVEEQCGQWPDVIVTSYKQHRKISNFLSDSRRFNITPRYGSEKLKAKISWNALSMQSPGNKEIPIIIDRFCEDDRIYFLNTDHITMHHAPDHGWFDDDGSIFMRQADDDSYEARYGGYKQAVIHPPFQGVLTGLA
jgi:hypothetical protein